jgi:hypothetical protein
MIKMDVTFAKAFHSQTHDFPYGFVCSVMQTRGDPLPRPQDISRWAQGNFNAMEHVEICRFVS